MKFPRHARIFRGQFDLFPFAGTMFLLLLVVLLHSSMVFTPGLPIQLPEAEGLRGTTNATVTVAVDARRQFYYLNQLAREEDLRLGFERAVRAAHGPVTLVIQADRAVPYEVVLRLAMLARSAGIQEAVAAVQPPGSTAVP